MDKKWLKKSLLLTLLALALGFLFVGLLAIYPDILLWPFGYVVGWLVYFFFTIAGAAALASQIIASIRIIALVKGTIQKVLWLVFIWFVLSFIAAGLYYLFGEEEEY